MMHAHALIDLFEAQATLVLDPAAADLGNAAPRNMCAAATTRDFGRIKARGKNVLLHFWQPSVALRSALAETAYAELPCFTSVVAKADIAEVGRKVPDPLSAALLTELQGVFAAFAELLPANAMRIELGKARDRICPLFHVDRLAYRLMCTINGPGTEWLADGAVNRKALGHGDNRKIVKQGAYVYEAAPFQVCILKGEAAAGSGHGAVHRSPAVPDGVEGRWFLRVDAA